MIGRLLKTTGNGRREKVAEELRAFARQGFAIDVVTLDDAAPEVLGRYREELAGVVEHWFVWKDPVLETLRGVKRLLLRARGRRDAAREVALPLRPKVAPSHWLNAFLSLPDPLLAWALVHRRALRRLVAEGGYTHVYTLSSPHSVHLAGLYLKRKFPNLYWAMSYRDPWSNYPLQHPALWVGRLNRRLEGQCLAGCDRAVIYRGWTPGGKEFFEGQFPQAAAKVAEAPYSGCNERAIDAILAGLPAVEQDRQTLRFVHLGTLYGNDHTPVPFLAALAGYLRETAGEPRISVQFLGSITADAEALLASDPVLRAHVSVEPYRPFAEAVAQLSRADVALWFQADRAHFHENIPAKVFEYVYLRLPVLAISAAPAGYAILDGHGLGRTLPGSATEEIRQTIAELARRKQALGDLRNPTSDLFARGRFVDWFERFAAQCC